MTVSRQEFERLVEEALASLPKRFADLLENVAVIVEEEPSEATEFWTFRRAREGQWVLSAIQQT